METFIFYLARVCGHIIPTYDVAQVVHLWFEEGALFQLGFEALLLQSAQHGLQGLHMLCYSGRKDDNIIQI